MVPRKNPDRVPMVLQVMDYAAPHRPEHVLTEKGLTMAERTKIEQDGVYQDESGNRFYMAAGDYTTRKVTFVGARGSAPQERKKGPAPENRAEPAPSETRKKKSDS